MQRKVYIGTAIAILLILFTFVVTKTVVTRQTESRVAAEQEAQKKAAEKKPEIENDEPPGYREWVDQITKPTPPLKSTFQD